MPLDGEYLPAPEWFMLIFFVPFIYFKNRIAPVLGLYLPFALFLTLALLPYFLAKRGVGRFPCWRQAHESATSRWRTSAHL